MSELALLAGLAVVIERIIEHAKGLKILSFIPHEYLEDTLKLLATLIGALVCVVYDIDLVAYVTNDRTFFGPIFTGLLVGGIAGPFHDLLGYVQGKKEVERMKSNKLQAEATTVMMGAIDESGLMGHLKDHMENEFEVKPLNKDQ